MNFLSGNSVTKFVRYWKKDALTRYVPVLQVNDVTEEIRPRPAHLDSRMPSKRPGSVRLTLGLTQATQIRFSQKDKEIRACLHRDMPQPNFDFYRKEECRDIHKTHYFMGDQKIGISYLVACFGLTAFTYGVKCHGSHYVYFMAAAADVLALASIEVDISNVPPGGCVVYKWRGKPVFVKNRSPADMAAEANTPDNVLREVQNEAQRTQKPEWLIIIGICTHLGCVPIPNTGDYVGGFYCPCHGSHYDNLGRTRKGPAPLNMVVPDYTFLSDTLVKIG